MDKIWAPWRLKYVTKLVKNKKGCIFCNILAEKKDAKNYIFIRGTHCFAVLNIYPYNNGHCLVLPNRHVNDISKLKAEEKFELFNLLEDVKNLLDKTLKPAGFNIGLNLGSAAGAGVPKHIHFHIVPRWRGDVNFMPVTAGTKVISQSLSALYKALVQACKAS